MLSMCRGNIAQNINEIIDSLELDEYKKLILRKRFLEQVILYNKKSRTAEFFYIFFSMFVTIGSIILPALLSIQQLDYSEDDSVDDLYRQRVYWTTWGISLLVSIFNGILQLFSFYIYVICIICNMLSQMILIREYMETKIYNLNNNIDIINIFILFCYIYLLMIILYDDYVLAKYLYKYPENIKK